MFKLDSVTSKLKIFHFAFDLLFRNIIPDNIFWSGKFLAVMPLLAVCFIMTWFFSVCRDQNL